MGVIPQRFAFSHHLQMFKWIIIGNYIKLSIWLPGIVPLMQNHSAIDTAIEDRVYPI